MLIFLSCLPNCHIVDHIFFAFLRGMSLSVSFVETIISEITYKLTKI